MYVHVAHEPVTSALKIYLRKRYPYKPTIRFTYEEVEALTHKMKLFRPAFSVVTMLQFFGMPLLWGYAFYQLYVGMFSLFIKPPAVFYPFTFAAFVIPGFFLMLMSLNTISKLIFRLFIRKYDRMYALYQMQEGYDNDKSFRAFAWLCAPLFVITLMVVSTCQIIAWPDKVRVKTMLMPSANTYAYSDAKHITWYTHYNGGIYQRYGVTVFMKDGKDIGLNWYFDDAEAAAPLVTIFQSKGIPADTVITPETK